ncbi:hypothetical protein SAMN03080617_01499 [Algoriphagus alkaliphilus]|uniref:Uncharacterized protein n=1 Tax=Algoriphagus alkaliphilus TaxID=279824 RepID=A0A1G5X310_9BACT|nr:hypothetical protein [Cyclobacterium sp.]SDA64177.1 hypothetical protein SAMN03080617_01499 [Algoriphagus alkaliphilus]
MQFVGGIRRFPSFWLFKWDYKISAKTKMRRKPIDKLYGLSAILILVLLLAKYLDLFLVPNWLLVGALI